MPARLLPQDSNAELCPLFHAFLAPEGPPLALLLVVLEAYLGFVTYRERFHAVLAP